MTHQRTVIDQDTLGWFRWSQIDQFGRVVRQHGGYETRGHCERYLRRYMEPAAARVDCAGGAIAGRDRSRAG